MVEESFNRKLSRRDLLKGSAVAAGALLAGPVLAACGSSAATAAPTAAPTPAPATQAPATQAPTAVSHAGEKVYVKNSGGSYQDATKKAIWDPFTAATGIEVVPVNIDSAALLASIQAGQVQVDVDDESEATLIDYQSKGALAKLDYTAIGKSFTLTDVPTRVRTDYMLGKCYWASVMAYRTDAFPNGTGPQSWADFWNATKFPGKRSMQTADADLAELEFALIANGTAADATKLYPLDIDKCLSLTTPLKPNILKFWDSGAESVQLLDQKEVVMTTIWNGRAQTMIDAGKPVAIVWNGARRQINFWAVPKGAPHMDLAMLYLDFAMKPDVQAAFSNAISYAPTNSKAQALLDPARAKVLGSTPDQFASGFDLDVNWWSQNLDAVTTKWTAWSQS